MTPKVLHYLASSNPCLFIPTIEDSKALSHIIDSLIHLGFVNRELAVWKSTTGMITYQRGKWVNGLSDAIPTSRPIMEFIGALNKVADTQECIGVFYHIRSLLDQPNVVQAIIDATYKAKQNFSTIIFIGSFLPLPPELLNIVTYVDFPLPTKDEIEVLFEELIQAWEENHKLEFPKNKKKRKEILSKAAMSAQGLDMLSAENALALAISITAEPNAKIIQSQKEQHIKKSDVLEYISTDLSLKDVGGFGALKEWLARRKDAFTDRAREYGLPWPKGILISGASGTGKSHISKCLASFLELPLLRLDMGKVFGRYVGDSVAGDTTIFVNSTLNSGLKLISRVRIDSIDDTNTEVISASPDFNKLNTQYSSFHIAHDIVDRPILEITTERGRCITTTEDHSLFTLDYDTGDVISVKGAEIREGDYIAAAKKVDLDVTYSSYPVWDLIHLLPENNTVLDTLCLNVKETKQLLDSKSELLRYLSYNHNGTTVPLVKVISFKNEIVKNNIKIYLTRNSPEYVTSEVKITPLLAELAGMWVGDGSFTRNSMRIHTNVLDKEVISEKIYKANHGAYKTEYSDRRVNNPSNGTTIFFPPETTVLLKLLGFSSSGKNRSIPATFLNLDLHLTACFLKGYFFTDGSFSNGLFECSSISNCVSESVCFLLSRLDIACSFSTRQGGSKYIVGRKVMYNDSRRLFIKAISDLIKFQTIVGTYGRTKDKIDAYLNCVSIEVSRDNLAPSTYPLRKDISKLNRLLRYAGVKERVKRPKRGERISMLRIVNKISLLKDISYEEEFPEIYKALNREGLQFLRITKIKRIPSYTGKMYDLSVPSSESFLTGSGILAHNSEANLRRALQIVEAVAPTVVQIDEAEKALSGSEASGKTDSGVTARVLSTLLTWRQETTYPVFMVYTANNPDLIPAMIYRKGRLDEIWAVDLPTLLEREEIFKIHLERRKRDASLFDTALLANRSKNFTGAEIEASIEDAMFNAFYDNVEVDTGYILKSIDGTLPQSDSSSEEYLRLKEWMSTRARSVSGPEENTTAKKSIPTLRDIKSIKKGEKDGN